MGYSELTMPLSVAVDAQLIMEAYPEIFDLPGDQLVPKPHLRHRHLVLDDDFPRGSLDGFCSRHTKLQEKIAEAWDEHYY